MPSSNLGVIALDDFNQCLAILSPSFNSTTRWHVIYINTALSLFTSTCDLFLLHLLNTVSMFIMILITVIGIITIILSCSHNYDMVKVYILLNRVSFLSSWQCLQFESFHQFKWKRTHPVSTQTLLTIMLRWAEQPQCPSRQLMSF